MACELDKYVGREVAFEFVIGCPDTLPDPGDWLPVGALRTKELSGTWDTVDATADDNASSLRSNLATYQSLEFSADGTCKRADGTLSNQTLLTQHFFNPTATGGQPAIWARMTFPDLTFTCFMLLSECSRSAPHDEITTFSLAMASSESPFGIIVEETPIV